MRYFIYYPPTKSLKRIDVVNDMRVQEIIDMVQHDFGLNVANDSHGKTAIVLNYNGSDLKSTWSLADLNLPSGAIIRCLYRKKNPADLYVHCGFNNQILELFDDTITIDTTIGEIRKKISDRIGLPLSTFCLETHDNKRRLYDQTKLFQYDLKLHDHIYLKVWGGYENFLNSCMKGFPKHYSHDDLTRNYQLQIALHIAAFYGFMVLGQSALRLGARSDCPVGEHPSRQWSSETTVQTIPEMLKCPIHIAIERGHMKMVDLFVRQSLFCTQVLHPISGFLPYRLALSTSMMFKTKVEKKRYSQIYLYLYDKQFNLKIPVNTSGANSSSLLTSNSNINLLPSTSTSQVFFSLPRYCKIIRWYERARERVWKKYGVHIDTSIEIKRSYQSRGLLGYKVMIDGFNNTFDASSESICPVTSVRESQIDQIDRYSSYSEEEREKIIKMKAYIKQFGADTRQGAKSAVTVTLQRSRQPPLLARHGMFGAKVQAISFAPTNDSAIQEDLVSSSEFSNPSSLISVDHQCPTSIGDTERSLNMKRAKSAAINPASRKPKDEQHRRNRKATSMTKTISKTVVHEKEEHEQQKNGTLPIVPTSTPNAPPVQSTWKQKLRMMVASNIIPNRQEKTSSVNNHLLSPTPIATNGQQQKIVAKRDPVTQTEQSSKNSVEKLTPKTRSPSVQGNRSMILDIGSHTPHLDHQTRKKSGPIRFGLDLEIQQATVKSYERHASASIYTTAVNCLQEAEFFKKKSWLKKVEISKEMVKQRAKRFIQRTSDENISCA